MTSPDSRPVVLIADTLDLVDLKPLEDAGIEVRSAMGIAASELPSALRGCVGLIVRSRTKVTAELLAAAPSLRVVGRAGTGVDNVDLNAATRAGVLVMNVPGGNTNAAAELTIALLFSLARHVPRAAASLGAGHWAPTDFVGVELAGKTLAIIGFGRIGQSVARVGRSLGMTVLTFDPMATKAVAEAANVELVDLDDVALRADFITVHVPLVATTRHLIGREFLGKVRPGVRILNVARGGVVDEEALLEALEDGRVAGAALDVFEKEPPGACALVRHPNVIGTPHLGASTIEAQRGVARQIALQVAQFVRDGAVEAAVNATGLDPHVQRDLMPWLDLGERLGSMLAGLLEAAPRRVEVLAHGALSAQRRAPFLDHVLVGLLRRYLGERVSVVNARWLAGERGLELSEAVAEHHPDFHALLSVTVVTETGSLTLSGALLGRRHPRVVHAFGVAMDAIPEGLLLTCMHDDRPGIVGLLGSLLGQRDVNIANMSLGRDGRSGRAVAMLNLDAEPTDEVLRELERSAGVRLVRLLRLPPPLRRIPTLIEPESTL